ncbi:MAG: RNA methyltransferase [Candidatus Saganbacteria bacterium]|nr:RNA methyltransferase [Candidatus Saganbacteria bacterium]
MIDSLQNPRVKELKKLASKKHRDKTGQFLVEGENLVYEAFLAKKLSAFYFTKETSLVAKLKNRGIKGEQIALRVLNALAATDEPQGIIGVATKPSYTLLDILKKEELLLLIVDQVQDPGNLGTMIRTASGVEADAVICTEGCVDLYNSKVLRSSAGAIFHLPVIETGKLEPLIGLLKENQVKTVATSQKGSRNYFEIRYNKRTALILGNEGQGLDPKIIEACGDLVAIPMWGSTESLNVAVSAGILLYDIALKKRGLV